MITHIWDHDDAGPVVILTCPQCGKRVEWTRGDPDGWHVANPGTAADDTEVRHEGARGIAIERPVVLT